MLFVKDWAQKVESQWNELCESVFASLQGTETLSLALSGENSLFVRTSQAKVRQATQVEQLAVSMVFKDHRKTYHSRQPLTLNSAQDRAHFLAVLPELRKRLSELPEDPFFIPMKNEGQSHFHRGPQGPEPMAIAEQMLEPAQGLDFVGFLTAGDKILASQNSWGQRHWFSQNSFFIDYSIYHGPKAAKDLYSGEQFDPKMWEIRLAESRRHLEHLLLPEKVLQPGLYRAYLSPHAVAEIAGLTDWGAWSYQGYKDGSSAFRNWFDGQVRLSEKLHVRENFGLGFNPRFNENGEVAPECLPLVEAGQIKNFLVSSKSAQEYKVSSNNASSAESPRSLEILPGDLDTPLVLGTLDRGVYLAHLHYLNWSDRQTARITGMTRFNCFYVEDGKIQGPIKDMRFDVSLFKMWGPNLLALTSQAETIAVTQTYEERASGGYRLPGMLVNDFEFTL